MNNIIVLNMGYEFYNFSALLIIKQTMRVLFIKKKCGTLTNTYGKHRKEFKQREAEKRKSQLNGVYLCFSKFFRFQRHRTSTGKRTLQVRYHYFITIFINLIIYCR